jgi:hypothetical protein
MALNRPPSDITPQAFFESWLPREYQRLHAAAGKMPPDATLIVALEGEGGGTWTLRVRAGALTAAAEDAGAADLRVAQSVADWRALLVGEDGALELVPSSANPMDLLLAANPAQAAQLKTIKGALRFEVTGFNDRTWRLDAMFNGAEQPKASITIDSHTYKQMADGTLPPPQAYFAGKIQIGGDVNFAMQLAMQMMASAQA